jgi:hypothetical protein
VTVALWKWTERGFFSEFNSMLLAKSYADLLDLQFILVTKPDTTLQSTWTNNFTPFCSTMGHERAAKLASLDESPSKQLLDSLVMSYVLAEPTLIPSVIFSNTLTSAYVAQLQSKTGNPLGYMHQCFKSVWKLNDVLSKEIDEIISELFKLSPNEPYHGIHVRRGDKLDHEAGSVEIERYIEKLNFADAKVVYVASDDYSAVTQVREQLAHRGEDEVKVYSLCQENMRGYHQAKFDELSNMEKQASIRLLLTEFEILRNSVTFVGSFSSNVGRAVHVAREGVNSFSTDIEFSLCFDPYANHRRSRWFSRLLASILS